MMSELTTFPELRGSPQLWKTDHSHINSLEQGSQSLNPISINFIDWRYYFDYCLDIKTTITLEFLYFSPQFWKTALNSGKVKKPLKMANFDGQKSECGVQKKVVFPESILTPTFCKKRGPNWSNFASVGPFVFYIQL